MTSPSLKNATQSGVSANYKLKLYVQDDNDAWVDLSTEDFGDIQNRLVRLGYIRHSAEKRLGVFNTSLSGVTLRNDDAFFNKPLGTPGLTTTVGTAAVFSPTGNYGRSVFYRHKVKVSVVFDVRAWNTEEVTLGVFLWDTSEASSDSGIITVALKSLSDALRDVSAEKVTDGLNWYSSRPSWFLVEELVKQAFKTSTGELPEEYSIQRPVEVATHDGQVGVSAYGPIGDYAKADGETVFTWRYPTGVCQSMVYGTVGAYTGLFCGMNDSSVWFFDPVNETYEEIVPASDIGAGYPNTIYLAITQAGDLLGMSIADQDNSTSAAEFVACGVAMRLWDWDGTTFTSRLTRSAFWSGLEAFRTIGINANYQSVGPAQDLGGGTGKMNGNSLFIPFKQRVFFKNTNAGEPNAGKPDGWITANGSFPTVIYNNLKTSDYLEGDGEFDLTGFAVPKVFRNSYWTIWNNLAAEGFLLFSYNTQGCIFRTDVGGGVDEFHWFECNSEVVTSDDARRVTYDCRAYNTSTHGTGSEGTFGLNDGWTSGGPSPDRSGAPVCLVWDASAGKGYIGAYHSGWGHPGALGDDTALYDTMDFWEISFPAGVSVVEKPITDAGAYPPCGRFELRPSDLAALSVINTSTEGSRWMPCELIMFNSELCGVLWSQTKGDYVIVSNIATYDVSTGLDIRHRTFSQPMGLVVHDSKLYFYESGTGRIGSFDTSWNLTYVSKGDPAVPNSPFLTAGLVLDSTNGILYGVSSPSRPKHPWNLWEQVVGKRYLFKLDTVLTDRIELADFSGMDCWEAIGQIAEANNGLVGFDTNGNFFYRQRLSAVSTADVTIVDGFETEVDADTYKARKVSINSNEDEVYNYASLVPFSSVTLEPTYEVRLVKRVKGDTGFVASDRQKPWLEPHIDFRSSQRQTLKLVCTNPGNITHASTKHMIRMKFQAVKRQVEVSVGATYTDPSTTVTLASVFGGNAVEEGVHTGDLFVVTDPDDEGTEVARQITAVDSDTQQITIDTTVGFDMAIGMTAQILRENAVSSGHERASWSDDGVTYITAASGTGNVVPVMSVEQLAVNMVVEIEQDEERISAIDTVSSPPEITITRIDDTAENFSVNHPSGTKVKAWWAPNALDEWFDIGGSGIRIMFTQNATGNQSDPTFKEGDVITVVVPGEELQEDEHAQQVSINTASVLKYGRREYPGQSNRFLTRSRARNLAHTIVGQYKEPRLKVIVEMLLGLDIQFSQTSGLTRVDVRSPYLFAHAAYVDGTTVKPFTLQCFVQQIEHDVQRKITQLTLAGVRAI